MPGGSKPDGWRVPCFGLAMTPNEQDETRALAARYGKPVATVIRELVLAEARRAAQHPAYAIEINHDTGTARVMSQSAPGTWHLIDAEGRCDCKAAEFGRLCSHVKALREVLDKAAVKRIP